MRIPLAFARDGRLLAIRDGPLATVTADGRVHVRRRLATDALAGAVPPGAAFLAQARTGSLMGQVTRLARTPDARPSAHILPALRQPSRGWAVRCSRTPI